MIVKIRNLVLLCCAWCLCQCARADYEIESFTRYRIDNFDNNNNGYVNEVGEEASIGQLESTVIASQIATKQATSIGESYRTVSFSQSQGVQFERVLLFKTDRRLQDIRTDEAHTDFEVGYGVKYFQFNDSYALANDFLWPANSKSEVDNQIFGPQLRLNWRVEQGPWQVEIGGAIQYALNLENSSQLTKFGQDLLPGQHNRPLFLMPSWVEREQDDNSDTMHGEIRGQVTRQINHCLSLNFGLSGYYFGGIEYASDSANLIYPTMGFKEGVTQDIIVSTAFANLEFRR